MSNQKIIYFSYNGVLDTVFDSQVLALLERLKKRGTNVQFVACDPWKLHAGKNYTKKRQTATRLLGETANFFRRSLFWGRTSLRGPVCNLLEVLNAANAANYKQPVILHCKGAVSAYIALKCRNKFPNIKIHADLRGLNSEEIYLYLAAQGWTRLFRTYLWKEMKAIERETINGVDSISCVSNAFKELLVSQHPGLKKIEMIPCAVETSRFYWDKNERRKIRDALNLGESLTLVYSGGMQKWQMFKSIINKFNELCRATKHISLLVLTNDYAGDGFQRIENSNTIMMSVEHQDVPRYLLAGDIGIIMRENNLVNRVACPTKIAEYMACGLKIFATPCIGDIDDHLTKFNAGINFTPDDSLDKLIMKLNGIDVSDSEKARIESIAKKLFSWDTYVDKLLSIYEDLSV